jgi:hypothetical protein
LWVLCSCVESCLAAAAAAAAILLMLTLLTRQYKQLLDGFHHLSGAHLHLVDNLHLVWLNTLAWLLLPSGFAASDAAHILTTAAVLLSPSALLSSSSPGPAASQAH